MVSKLQITTFRKKTKKDTLLKKMGTYSRIIGGVQTVVQHDPDDP